jgi:hypothetical protein
MLYLIEHYDFDLDQLKSHLQGLCSSLLQIHDRINRNPNQRKDYKLAFQW